MSKEKAYSTGELLILQGIGMLMDMVMDAMPTVLAENWIDEVNEFNQSVTDTFGESILKEKEKEQA